MSLVSQWSARLNSGHLLLPSGHLMTLWRRAMDIPWLSTTKQRFRSFGQTIYIYETGNFHHTKNTCSIFHIEEFCDFSGMGLSPFSEQAAISLHHKFSKCRENFFVKDFDNPSYPDRFLSAVSV